MNPDIPDEKVRREKALDFSRYESRPGTGSVQLHATLQNPRSTPAHSCRASYWLSFYMNGLVAGCANG